ncbi:alkaline serine protease [Kineobactrum sediminis]|uniref:Alkaline serine protease n=1 Tax=Kineobactrum sediminis TaxID=1905677 RepID=A0A2N5XZV3_9GAMM|nr:S8 family peptidase [Kineobactrum sediminis]PLW81682.1 alkaline serine protease [Kineobactrum sediminis]
MKCFQCLPYLLGLSVAAAGATDVNDHDLMKIMVQGKSTAELRQLVEQHGGTITHDLPIIKAIGATVSASQLEQIRISSLVSRIIDDLSMDISEPEVPPERADCDIGGALEATLENNSLQWQLFNKQEKPAKLQHIELGWPTMLGAVVAAKIDQQDLALPIPSTDTGPTQTASAHYEATHAPALSGITTFQLRFEHPLNEHGKAPRWQQSDFSIKLEFAGGCSTKLIPGYPDYEADTYYPGIVGADALHLHGIRGKGVTVAVLDSGLWEHPALAYDTNGNPRIVGRFDAINNIENADVFDDSGHGTHMTSVIAHSGEVFSAGVGNGSYKGIAPDVKLVAVKAFDEQGQGEFLDIVRGIQWIVEQKDVLDIKVLNLSFAARPRWPYFLDPINQALMQAWAAGITVIAAAGNEGPEPMTIGSPGNLPYLITVGAVTDSWTTTDRDDDYIPDFSSRGPTPSGHIKPDIVAPGGHIAGLMRPGSKLMQKHPDYLISTGELVMTGTSQASALVSGIAALLLQLEPELKPDDVKCKLLSSADLAINRDGRLSYSPFQQGNGYVNAVRAVTLGQRGCGNQDMNIQRDIAAQEHFEGPAIMDEKGNATLPGLNRMLSPTESEKGLSTDRKWGIKAYIERKDAAEPSGDLPFHWLEIYLSEKSTIESLSTNPPPNDTASP